MSPFPRPNGAPPTPAQHMLMTGDFGDLGVYLLTCLPEILRRKNKHNKLVDGFNHPSDENIRQIGSLPLIGMNIQNIRTTHHPVLKWLLRTQDVLTLMA